MTLVFSGDAWAQDTCASIKPFPTKITVNLIIPDPHYDLTSSLKSLNKNSERRSQEWLEANGLTELWRADEMTTLGTASGGWGSVWSMTMKSGTVDRFGAYRCAYFREINLELFYRTLITIPNDYPKGSCPFNFIHEHEMRHHLANKKAVEIYVNRLRDDMKLMVAEMEAGYVGSDKVPLRFEEMKQGMRDAVEIYLGDYMKAEMDRLNSAIDTPEEYAGNTAKMESCRKSPGR